MKDANFVLWTIMAIMTTVLSTGNRAESAAVGNMFVSVTPAPIVRSCLSPTAIRDLFFIYTVMTLCITFVGFLGIQIIHICRLYARTCDHNLIQTAKLQNIWMLLSSYVFECIMCIYICIFSHGAAAQRGLWPPHSRGFSRSHTRRATVGRTALGK
jgi:hypothetical protein